MPHAFADARSNPEETCAINEINALVAELSQAQLNQAQAQIAEASAKYDYQVQTSVLNYQMGLLH
ncbi:MAG: hypothetical protein WB723_19320 [Candidatus Acidiferrales bacterium]